MQPQELDSDYDEEIKDFEQPMLAKATSGTEFEMKNNKNTLTQVQDFLQKYQKQRAPSGSITINIRKLLQDSDEEGGLSRSDVRSVADAQAYKQKQQQKMLIKSQPVPTGTLTNRPSQTKQYGKPVKFDVEMGLNQSKGESKVENNGNSYFNHDDDDSYFSESDNDLTYPKEKIVQAEDYIASSEAASNYLAEHVKRQNEKMLTAQLTGMGFEKDKILRVLEDHQDEILDVDQAINLMFEERDIVPIIAPKAIIKPEIIPLLINQNDEANKEDAKSEDGPQRMCDSCYEECPENDFFSLSCKHEFCKDCFIEHLETNINDGKVMQIPCMQGCGVHFEENDVRQFGSAELYKKYLRFKQNIDVDLDDNLKWCPKPGCINYVKKNGKNKKVVCECGQEVCFRCGQPWHEGIKCENAGDKDYDKWAEDQGDVQNCPMCGIHTWKDGGCNKMTCRKCHGGWCWVCAEPNIDYGHFSSGNDDLIALIMGRTGCTGTLHGNDPKINKNRKKKSTPIWPLLLRLIFLPLIMIFGPAFILIGKIAEGGKDADSCCGSFFIFCIVLPIALPFIFALTTSGTIVFYYPFLFALITKIRLLFKRKYKINNCLWPCGWCN